MRLGLVVVIVLFMLVIIGALGSGLFYLVADKKRNPKVLKALTLRIVLSIILFALLIGGFLMGWIQPHGLYG